MGGGWRRYTTIDCVWSIFIESADIESRVDEITSGRCQESTAHAYSGYFVYCTLWNTFSCVYVWSTQMLVVRPKLELCGTSSFKTGLLKRLRPPEYIARSSCVSLQHGRLVLILDKHKVFESVSCIVIVIGASPRQFDARSTTIDVLIECKTNTDWRHRMHLDLVQIDDLLLAHVIDFHM